MHTLSPLSPLGTFREPEPLPGNFSGTQKVIQIPLTRGLFALVDEADYPLVAPYKWRAYQRNGDRTFYAIRTLSLPNGRRGRVLMHRAIMPGVEFIDHRDCNGLNNTRANLRPATVAENCRNIIKPRHGVTSRFKGVSWNRHAGKFQATVRFQRRNIYLGLFVDEIEAAYTYDREARSRFGFFARTNFPLPPMVIREAA